MEKYAKELYVELKLNKFADCTEAEYLKQTSNKTDKEDDKMEDV